MIENRKFIRLRAPLPVEYRLIKKHKRQKSMTSMIHNISVGGLSLALKESARQGDIIEVSIGVPHLEDPVLVVGDVIWHRLAKDKDQHVFHQAGLRFRDVDPIDLHKILDYVYSVAIG
jgi:c-di-GMP-binding flagellar brake protein YcgR